MIDCLREHRFGRVMYHKLFVQPQGFLGQRGKIFVGHRFDIHSGKVVPNVYQALPQPLVFPYRAAVDKFTMALCRV